MIAHIIPETYLKAWKNEKANSTYCFDKLKLIPENKNLNSMSNTLFALYNEYILSCEKCSSYIYKDLFEGLYKDISIKYDIFYKEKIITVNALRIYIKKIYAEEDIVVLTKEGFKVRTTKLKNDINKYWNTNVSKTIEDFLNVNYENDWKSFIESIKISIAKQKEVLDFSSNYDYLIEFISIQISRQKDKFKKIYESIEQFSKIENTTNLDNKTEEYWLLELFKFILYKNDSSKYQYNIVTLIINYFKNISFKIYIVTSSDIEYITSDNPIYQTQDNKFIIFPLSPTMCIIIDEKNNNQNKNLVTIKNISNIDVKRINNLTLQNSKKNVIFSHNNIKEVL